ncbi:mucoidy inhibitor MuiA family protein [Methylocapsa sp. S129]|uniref:mucoidy inhibitor MuiA family protein n=1 Tax=Methylocapsa sp. S129 TaxID=1641869 RepID=UPI00131D728D|nr:mucoidy inhibitor MuiA family protein [Methylocapsa sp. S129]
MRTIFSLSACSFVALLFAAPALAGEIEVASKIDSVTVYPDAAIIWRIAEVDLPPGESVLTFRNLPLALDPASLRLDGEGSAKVTIGAVDTQVAPAEIGAPDNSIEAKLTSLRAEKEGWQSTIDALAAKRAMIIRFSQSGPEKLSSEAKPLDIGQWNGAWDMVAVGLAKLGDDLRPAVAKARQLDDQIKSLEAQSQRPVEGQGAQRSATVTVTVDSQTQARIKLSYRIGGVGWRPTYDASLDTTAGAKTLSLTRRASLTQHTGEDWSDVALIVSTARVARASDIPDVEPLKIDFWQPPEPDSAAPLDGAMPKAPMARAAPTVESMPSPPLMPKLAQQVKAEEVVSQTESGAYSAEFKTPGRVSLASGGAQKSFVLTRVSAQPTILVKAAPGLDQTAYLQAHFVDAEEAPLLPGEVALHRDGAFVGQSRMAFVAPGDGLDMGFGADDKIKIQRAPVNRKENEPTWYNQTKIETREFKTTVRNLHDFPVKVQVIDRLPISENTAITVEMLPTTTPPTEKQIADKRGVMSWTLDLAPNEAKDIRLVYRLKWPADRDVTMGGASISANEQ